MCLRTSMTSQRVKVRDPRPPGSSSPSLPRDTSSSLLLSALRKWNSFAGTGWAKASIGLATLTNEFLNRPKIRSVSCFFSASENSRSGGAVPVFLPMDFGIEAIDCRRRRNVLDSKEDFEDDEAEEDEVGAESGAAVCDARAAVELSPLLLVSARTPRRRARTFSAAIFNISRQTKPETTAVVVATAGTIRPAT